MKATELRIGNSIMFIGTDIIVERIENLDNRQQMYWVKPKGLISSKIIHFSGIPISEEWILSFNFKEFRYMFNDELLIGYVPFNLISHEYNTYILQKYGDKYYMMTNGDNRQIISSGFDYVHQLQNIFFALTNRELISNKITKQHIP